VDRRLTMVKKTIGGTKNGGSREVPAVKAPKWYPADDIKPKLPSEREANSRGIAKLKPAIKPGSVLILLGGRFRGKRVVFLKQLPSGLLLVSGPYQVNGVPLRRVNQAYCITTSATIDIKGADVSKVDDAFFARTKKPKSKKEDEFFAEENSVRAMSSSPSLVPCTHLVTAEAPQVTGLRAEDEALRISRFRRLPLPPVLKGRQGELSGKVGPRCWRLLAARAPPGLVPVCNQGRG